MHKQNLSIESPFKVFDFKCANGFMLEASERQAAILDSLDAHIALLNEHGIIIEVNEAWKRFAEENQLSHDNYGIGLNYLDISEKAGVQGVEEGKAMAKGIREVSEGIRKNFTMEYSCDSPEEKRWFRAVVTPLSRKCRAGAVVAHFNITATKTAELQIEFDRRNRDALINSTNDLMWSIDRNLKLITANRAFCDIIRHLTGVEIKTGDYVLFPGAFDASEVEEWEKRYGRVLAGESFNEVKFMSNSTKTWVQMSFFPIMEAGEVIGAACYTRDITEQKSSEERIRQTQRMMTEAEHMANFGSWELYWDENQTPLEGTTVWSNQMYRIFGYEPGECLPSSEHFFSSVHPDDRDFVYEQFFRLLEEDVVFTIKYRIIKPDGTVRWVWEKAKTIRNKTTGRLEKVTGTTLDITERKESIERLQQAEQNYREIFDKASDAILVIDKKNGHVIDVNLKACEKTGYSKEEVLYGSLESLMAGTPGFTMEDAMTHVTAAVNEGQVIFEWLAKHKDGTLFWTEVNLVLATIAGVERFLAFFRLIEDRKKAEESIRISNERYELVTRATNDAIWDWNLLTNEVYWSEVYQNTYGFKNDNGKITNETWVKRIHPDDRARVVDSLEKALHDKNINFWQCEYRFIRFDHSIAHVCDKGYIIYDESGSPVRMVGALQDITERKIAEEALQKKTHDINERVKELNCLYSVSMILNNSCLSTDEMMQKCVNCIPKAYQYSEIARARIIMQGKEFTSPGFMESEWKQMMKIYLREVCVGSIEVFYLEKKPDEYVGPFLKEELALIHSIARNITLSIEQKRSEESLQGSEANLRMIFENTDNAFILLDTGFKIVSFNSIANDWARIAFGSVLKAGEMLLSKVVDEHKEKGYETMRQVLAGQTVESEISYPFPDGSSIWFYSRLAPVQNEKGEFFGVCITAKEITQQKNYEIERDKMTGEIIQRNKDLEQFAYIVSHNLRAPVANIIGFAEALKNFEMDETESRMMLDGLADSVAKLDVVITDLNTILQIKREFRDKWQPVCFSDIVEDIKISINHLIETENIVMRTDFSGADEMFTSRSYLYSIFYNLISNSIKYRKPGQPTVIEIKSRKAGPVIELIFSDNGLGIDLERAGNQLFGLYKRFHHGAAEGKGMGLFMIKTQIEALGGKISVKSQVNEGTEFIIEFKS